MNYALVDGTALRRRSGSDSSRATCARKVASSCSLGSNRRRDLVDNIRAVLLLLAEKWIQESGVADVVAKFPMLEEDVHGFP